ncbi:MAG TPA: CoA transferase [Streptosporangiaceae bacterium]|jgi:crotonobetainyl-CoA:carnitine CoA-transferase CaiB-like acyl-CoA transferase
MSPQDTGIFPAAPPAPAFDPLPALDDLLATAGVARAATGGAVSITGQDPIVPAAHRLGACIGIPIMAAAVAAAAFHRQRGGPGQDLGLDLRQAIHGINPGAFWHPALNGQPAPHPLVLDNPFLLTPYRTADGRWIMASGVYPHLAARWCRFLDVPPGHPQVAAAIGKWQATELEDTANAAGLPACVARSPEEWLAHPHGALLASQPVIGLERIGDAPARDFGPAQRPFDGVRVLSFTHAVAGPTVGRTLAEHGADVLCATRPNDYEHEFIYAEANLGSRNAYVDLANPAGQTRAATLLAGTDIVVSNHRSGTLERHGLEPRRLAEKYPGLICVSVTCYGSRGPWARRGGFDMNGSAASGLMTTEGTQAEPRLPITGLINDYITGYLGAVGACAALVKRTTEGGSWHITVNLTRTAMWCRSLGLVNPDMAGCDDEHSLREPVPYNAPTPLGDVHMLAPPVRFSATPPRWPDPPLVPRGSSLPEWLPTARPRQ